MFLGIANAISGIKSGGLSFIKDNLKLYLDFKSNKSDTLKFPSEGSTSFDGSDNFIDCGNDSSLQFSGSFSVGCWFKTTDATATNEILVSQANDGTNDSWLIRLNSSRKLEFEIYRGGSILITDSGSASNDGNWHHVVAVHESGVGNKLYKNGSLVASNSTGTDLTEHVPNFHIGNQDHSTARAINADICNVFAYSRALTPEEIQSIQNKSYSQLKGVEKTSLVAWWALDSTVSTEKITNGDFSAWTADNPDGWSVSTDLSGGAESDDVKVTEDANGARFISDGTNINLRQSSIMTVGRTYEVVIVVHSATSGDLKTTGLSSNITNINASGTYTVTTTASSTTFNIKRNTACDIVVSSVSVKEVQTPDSLENNNGAIIGATTTTSVYGGNAPILPRAVDVAKEGQADNIGNGSALFNGTSDIIDIGSNSILDNVFVGGATITAWIKPSSDGENSLGRIFDKSDSTSGTDGWHLVILAESSGSCDLRFGHGRATTTGIWDTTNTEVNIDEWTHVAVTYNNSSTDNNATYYINGISVAVTEFSTPSGNAVDDSSRNLFIGNNTGLDRTFDGSIAGAGIWKGELTQSQIQSIIESTSYQNLPADVKSTLGSSEITSSSNTTFSGVTSNDWAVPADVTKSFSNDQMIFTMDDDTPAGYVAQFQAGNFAGGSGIPQKFLKVTLDIDSTTTGSYRINNAGGSLVLMYFTKSINNRHKYYIWIM